MYKSFYQQVLGWTLSCRSEHCFGRPLEDTAPVVNNQSKSLLLSLSTNPRKRPSRTLHLSKIGQSDMRKH